MSLSRQSIALVLTTKNNETKHHIHRKHKRETHKPALANRAGYTLVWYAFYDLRSQNSRPYSYRPGAHARLVDIWLNMISMHSYIIQLLNMTFSGSFTCCMPELWWRRALFSVLFVQLNKELSNCRQTVRLPTSEKFIMKLSALPVVVRRAGQKRCSYSPGKKNKDRLAGPAQQLE